MEIKSNYRVAAGQTLSFTDTDAILLFEAAGSNRNTLTVDGTIDVKLGSLAQPSYVNVGGIVGIYARAADLLITPGGVYKIDAPSNSAVGYFNTEGGRSVFFNQGLIDLSGGSMLGVLAHGGLRFENSGTFRVTGGNVAGVDLHGGGLFNNTGTIEVSGGGGGWAVRMDGLYSTFTNAGAVTITGAQGVAVQWNAEGGFTNTGLIDGGYALKASPYTSGPNTQIFANAGTMRGTIELGSGDEELRNTGLVQGDVRLGAGADTYSGGSGQLVGDLSGGVGNDSLAGGGAGDRLFGGDGADTVTGGGGVNYLRGEDGDDTLLGGADFDDVHGNTGDDTAAGGEGGDWVVGGKGADLLYGDDGDDIVYGNLGADTCEGGDGADIVRGGQEDDVLRGGAGDDFLSGDRGSDTVTGGAGADIFHAFSEAGLDRVLDFNAAEGDRVMLDPGTTFSVSQVAGDTVVSLSGGGEVVLVGVSMWTLQPGWLFVA